MMLTVFQDVKSASEFYEGKIKDLAGNITDLEAIVQNKSNTLRAVEEGMHHMTPIAELAGFTDFHIIVLKQKILAQPK